MKVWIIDPNSCGIDPHEIAWDHEDYLALNDEIYKLGKFTGYDIFPIAQHDCIYLDDNGLYKPLKRWNWSGHQLCGIGIVIGHHGSSSVDTHVSLHYLAAHIRWGVWHDKR